MIKVIIADDEEKVCQLIVGLIDWEALDMQIVGVACNGVEALDMIKKLVPDLIITDIRMPGYDGLEMIHRAKIIKKDLDFIIISGYRHFEYAQNAIKYGVGDYILKPIKKDDFMLALNKIHNRYMQRREQLSNEERLKIRLKSGVEKLRNNLFTEILLKNSIPTQDLTLEIINENYQFSFQPGLFQVFAIKIDFGYEEKYNNAIKVLEEKVLQVLNKLLKDQCFDIGIYLDNSFIYCILNYKLDLKKIIRKQIKLLSDELKVQKAAFEQFEFTIGAGMAVENINKLKDTFKSAKFAIGQRLLLGTGKFIEHEEIQEISQKDQMLLAELNKTMGAALEVLDKNLLLDCIANLKERILSLKHLNGETIYSIVENACEMYLIHLRNNQIQINNGKEFYEKFLTHANCCSSIDKLFEYLSLTLGESLDTIIEDKKQRETKPIRLAKLYMNNNYMKSINLEEVSSFVGFNPTYFSTLFKKISGSNFVDYLSEIRMNKAKDLLRETNLNISVICKEVGYNDLKHFTKSFKKYTGLKPNEFRKLYS